MSPAPPLYDAVLAPIEALGFERLRARLVEPVAGDVLELGVGTGRQLRHYGAGSRVIALDPDPAAIARAAERAPSVGLRVGVAEDIPSPTARSIGW